MSIILLTVMLEFTVRFQKAATEQIKHEQNVEKLLKLPEPQFVLRSAMLECLRCGAKVEVPGEEFYSARCPKCDK